jgi:hypothetical protein
MIVGIVNCDLASSSLMQNDFLRKDYHLNPFEVVYLQTVLRMNRTALLKTPILSDDIFLSRLNELEDNTNGEFFSDENSIHEFSVV